MIEIFPELSGSERELIRIMQGATASLDIDWINREGAEGETLYHNLLAMQHKNADGQVTGLLCLVQDCTTAGELKQRLSQSHNELRLAQQQMVMQRAALETANAELQQLDALKSAFVSVTVHELRSPLTVILGYLEMLIDEDQGQLNEIQHEYLAMVQDSAVHLSNITDKLLDVARIDVDRVALFMKEDDLEVLVHEVVRGVESDVESRDLQLVIKTSPGLPRILCDPKRTAQIIGCLVRNAVFYSLPHGKIEIVMDKAQEVGFLQLSVMDTGIGIEIGEQDRIFKRFFRGSNARQSRTGGVGLDLYIAKSLAELQGGRIWFESAVGEGSSFHVTFPESA